MKRGVVLIALAACGSSSGGADAVHADPCSVQLSGALTNMQTCGTARMTWMSSSNASQFTLNLTTSSPVVQIAIGFPGKPTVGQHVTTGDGGVTVTDDAGKMWDSTASGGSFDLSFTAVTSTIVSATGTTYVVDGALTASVPAASGTGASGTVMLTATF